MYHNQYIKSPPVTRDRGVPLMGIETSREAAPPRDGLRHRRRIRSTNSYYGSVGIYDEIDDSQLTDRLRALQHERLYKRHPELRPGASILPSGSLSTSKLKTFVSVGSPEPFIAIRNDCHCISFGLKSERPGQMAVAAGSRINSLRFVAGERCLISIPLPQKESFTLNIVPDVKPCTEPLGSGFTPVLKHLLVFKFEEPATFTGQYTSCSSKTGPMPLTSIDSAR
jgi:hypothetical protein